MSTTDALILLATANGTQIFLNVVQFLTARRAGMLPDQQKLATNLQTTVQLLETRLEWAEKEIARQASELTEERERNRSLQTQLSQAQMALAKAATEFLARQNAVQP